MPNRKEAARTQFLRGTLDLMILGSLDTLGPLHGYAIAARARYYEITAAGRRSLAAEKREWDRMVVIMHAVFGEA